MTPDSSTSALSWLANERNRQRNFVAPISFADSREWSLVDGRISHTTGRFFDVVGVQWSAATGELFSAPFINQPEVGILGILVARTPGEIRMLLDAKFEPGNANGVDVAPSFQATKSNAERAHGGLPPQLSDLFLDTATWITGQRQSEQGTRFLAKWNMNVIVEIEDTMDAPRGMSWFTFSEAQQFLRASHALNTDARSVFATADWDLWLSGHKSRAASPEFARDLVRSLSLPVANDFFLEINGRLDAWHTSHTIAYDIVPVIVTSGEVRLESSAQRSPSAITHVHVESDSRERAAWDQPLLSQNHVANEILLCAYISGELRFWFTPVAELGLARAQLGNSVSSYDPARVGGQLADDKRVEEILASSCELLTIVQSDEGGRFERQLVEYSLRAVPDYLTVTELDDSGIWLTLAELQTLLAHSGYFTNEARTSISLILGLF